MKRKLLLKVMILCALAWGGFATMKMLDSAAGVIENTVGMVESTITMYQIGMYLTIEYSNSKSLPGNVKELVALIRRQEQAAGRDVSEDMGKDPWGQYFRLAPAEKAKKGVCIASAGPDNAWDTDDDLSFFQSLAEFGGDSKKLLPDKEKRRERKGGPSEKYRLRIR